MEQAEDSSPDPSACEIQISRGFAKSFPQKIVWQNRVRIVPPPARILGGQNTKEKCPFLLQEKSHPRQIKKTKRLFLLVGAEGRGAGPNQYERRRQFGATAQGGGAH